MDAAGVRTAYAAEEGGAVRIRDYLYLLGYLSLWLILWVWHGQPHKGQPSGGDCLLWEWRENYGGMFEMDKN